MARGTDRAKAPAGPIPISGGPGAPILHGLAAASSVVEQARRLCGGSQVGQFVGGNAVVMFSENEEVYDWKQMRNKGAKYLAPNL